MTERDRKARNRIVDLLFKAASVMVLRIGGSVLSFAFSFLAVRLLGAEGAGYYFLAFSVMMFCAVFARVGLDGTILRFVAHHASLEEWPKVQAAFQAAIRVAGGTTAVLGLLIFLGAEPMARVAFDKPDAAGALRFMGLAVITLSQVRLIGQALKGLNRQAIAETVASVIQPLFGLVLLYPLVIWNGAAGAALAFLLSSLIAAIIGHAIWLRGRRGWPSAEPGFDLRQLRDSAVPLWFSSTINQAVIPWAPVALLGIWSTAAEVGLFGAATRLSNIIAVLLVGVNSVLAPQFSRMNATSRVADIGPLSRQFALIVTLATMPVFAVLIFSGNWVMGLFGEEFRIGGPILAILAIGQLFSALCGSGRTVLIMTGNETGLRNSSALSLLVLGTLAMLLIPAYGAIGAAFASTAGLIATNALPVVLIWRKLGVMVVPGLNLIWRDRADPPNDDPLDKR